MGLRHNLEKVPKLHLEIQIAGAGGKKNVSKGAERISMKGIWGRKNRF